MRMRNMHLLAPPTVGIMAATPIMEATSRATLCHQEAMDVDRETQADCTPEEALRVLIENDFNCSFRVLGNQLGLKPLDLNILEMSQCPKDELLAKILHKCGEKELLSWTKIVSVLRKPAIKQYRIANKICLERNLSHSSRAESGSSMHSSTSLSFEDSPTFITDPETGKTVMTLTHWCQFYCRLCVFEREKMMVRWALSTDHLTH